MAEIDPIANNAVPERWLITGGCGFIGTNLIRYLKRKFPDTHIRVMDNLSVGTREDLSNACEYEEVDGSCADYLLGADRWPNRVQLVVGDVKDADACLVCTHGMDVVVHLAANTGVGPSVENPRCDMETNVIGTFNMLEASRQNHVGRFVFASSGAPIGEVDPPIHEELAPHPVSPYGASKLACEGYCSAYYRSFGLQTVALRFGNVYGPGSRHKSSVIAKFIRQALRNEILQIFGDGQQTRDFIFVDDLVRAVLLATTRKGVAGEAFQIATNSETTVAEVVELLKVIFSEKGLDFPEVTNSAPRAGDVKRNFFNTHKAKNSLGWLPSVVLREGMEETVEWFR